MFTRLIDLQSHLTAPSANLTGSPPAKALASLIDAGLDHFPLPGQGETLSRWRLLAAVAAHDLCLFKLLEGHVDALAIMVELGMALAPGSSWGVWCAEPPDAVVRSSLPDAQGVVLLHGRKAWCSGAAELTHALVSTKNENEERCLVSVALDQASVTVTSSGWHAVGMGRSASFDVVFDQARAIQVGQPGAYLSRPGFWQGGAGIASGWYGAAAALGDAVQAACQRKSGHSDPHQLAHLGHIDVALSAARAILHEAADWIDRHPAASAQAQALRARLAVEACANQVMHHAGRALGAGPLCKDGHIAHLMADLPVFLRQSHAERDLAVLGQMHCDAEPSPWAL